MAIPGDQGGGGARRNPASRAEGYPRGGELSTSRGWSGERFGSVLNTPWGRNGGFAAPKATLVHDTSGHWTMESRKLHCRFARRRPRQTIGPPSSTGRAADS